MKHAIEIRRVLKGSIRMYFAPISGAVKGIRSELHRAERESEIHRQAESKPKKDVARHA